MPEGRASDNHVATMVVHPNARGVRGGTAFTHGSLPRTMEEVLGYPLLGCAATTPSARPAFHL
ncbi:MAG TPA: hypothetical protein VFX70_09390 [Mycobacteriales bacterium]|nr:hypothetical protein [Mycobacteriales bacterium]